MYPHAAQQPASKLYLQSGTTITVETALKALIIKSANDAAVTLAEAVEGEEAQFAHQMTATARAMGLRKTQFRNASGLHHPEQFTTAHNMAMLAHRLILDFPHYLYFFKDQSFEFRGQTYVTHNHLLRFMPNVAGMKTGYTKSSGYNLMSLYLSKETQLIGVVMGSNTASQRDNLMARLFAQHTAPKEQIEKQEKPAMQVTSQRKIFAARPFTQATDKDANNIFLNRQSDSTQWRLGGYLMAQARAKEAPLMQAMQKTGLSRSAHFVLKTMLWHKLKRLTRSPLTYWHKPKPSPCLCANSRKFFTAHVMGILTRRGQNKFVQRLQNIILPANLLRLCHRKQCWRTLK